CLGPCSTPVDPMEYRDMIRRAADVLQGRTKEVEQELKAKMETASKAQQYEIAALYRDQLAQIAKISQELSNISESIVEEADIVGVGCQDEHLSIHILMVRDFRVLGSE